jgi:MFS family permease
MESEVKLMKIENLNMNSELNKEEKNKSTMKANCIQIFTAMMANLSILSPGMGMAFPAITSEILLRDKLINFTASQVSWFASITPLHCPYGGPLSSYLVTKVGRKGALLVINILSMIHWTIAGFSSSDPSILFIQLLIARLITGFTIGAATTPSVMYSTEISNPKLKSCLAVLSAPFFLSNGALLIYFLGYITGVNALC